MNFDFLLIFEDFWHIQDRRNIRFLVGMPALIVILGFVSCFISRVDYFTKSLTITASVMLPILAFILAAIVFISNWSADKDIMKYETDRKLNGKRVTLYRYMTINFSYIIILNLFLIICYLTGSICSFSIPDILCLIVNALFSLLILHILFTIIMSVSDLYFILSRNG